MRLLIATLCTAAAPAFAQQQCGPVDVMLAGLAKEFQESPRVSALMSGGDILVVTAGPDGNWTAIGVSAEGQACILAAGEAFELRDAPAPGVDG